MRNLRLALLLVISACADGRSVLTLTIDSSGSIAGIQRFHVAITDTGRQRSAQPLDIEPAGAPVALPPPQELSLAFGADIKGAITIVVEAVATDGTTLASGSTTVEVRPSKSLHATVTLPGITTPDGGSGAMVSFSAPPPATVYDNETFGVDVKILDSAGETDLAAHGKVTLTINKGTLLGTTAVNANQGTAHFEDLAVVVAGHDYQLTASYDGVTPGTSDPLEVKATPWKMRSQGFPAGGVHFLAIAPTNSSRMYASSMAGLFRSSDGGQTWVAAHVGITSSWLPFWVAPHPTDDDRAFVTTYDGQVYSTINGGQTWMPRSKGLAEGYGAFEIVYHPSDHDRLYVATNKGIYSSVNAGASWQPIGLDSLQVTNLAIHPASPDVMYAATGNGLYKTSDGGGTWNPVAPTLLSGMIYVLALASDGSVVYVAKGKHIHSSLDGETAWSDVTISDTVECIVAVPGAPEEALAATHGGVFKTTNRVDWTLLSDGSLEDAQWAVMSPDDPNTVFAVTGMMLPGVWRSNNGGNHWEASPSPETAPPIWTLLAMRGAPNTIYAVLTNGDLYRSTNGGQLWTDARGDLLGTIARIAQVGDSPTALLASTGTAIYKTTDGEHWGSAGLNDVYAFALAVSTTNPNVAYAAGYEAAIWKTADLAAPVPTWTPCADDSTGTGQKTLALAGTALEPVLYAGTQHGLYKSIDGCTIWSYKGPLDAAISSIAVADDVVYVRAADNAVYVSTNGGESWGDPLDFDGDPRGMIVAVAPDHTAYAVTYFGRFMRSIDQGANWQAADVGLGVSSASVLTVNPNDSDNVFLGTFGGVFATTSGGL